MNKKATLRFHRAVTETLEACRALGKNPSRLSPDERALVLLIAGRGSKRLGDLFAKIATSGPADWSKVHS